MTMSAYSSAIVDAMLGWLKGFANWVLRLFNLAGSAGTSPLLWLSQNWLRMLIILLVIGMAGDIVVWLVRWRPHWVWFRKERVIVDDEHFFNDYDIRDRLEPNEGPDLEKNWQERDYVVASTASGRRRRSADRDASKTAAREIGDGRPAASFQRGERRGKRLADEGQRQSALRRDRTDDGDKPNEAGGQDFFGADGSRPGVTDYYEDEVFDVNSLPKAEDFDSSGTTELEDDSEA